MFRDGLLSPRSKLFGQTNARAPTPAGTLLVLPLDLVVLMIILGPSQALGRPGSMASMRSSAYTARGLIHFLTNKSLADSNITKSGIYKDDRDTVRRRTRHRDGKLLRGGIGLTTGLGWSDRYVLTVSPKFFPKTTPYQ